jgi:23S rRNA (adenine2030-N6)-methyltransferase
MLSYRHAFHAGNFADVLKHSLLVLLIQAMQRKETPLVYIDTHAGAGLYRFDDAYARKTAEFEAGIGKFWGSKDKHSHFKGYMSFLKEMNPDRQLLHYPGSPWLAQHFLRPQDRLQLSELHPSDFDLLNKNFSKVAHSSISKEDGFATLVKKLPPVEKRGLIFIDPSYEVKDDYQTATKTLVAAHKKFETGVYCLWYPILHRDSNERFISKLAATGIRRMLQIEHIIVPDKQDPGMVGSGLIIINPPYQIDEQAESLLPWLNKYLTGDQGRWKMQWLLGE